MNKLNSSESQQKSLIIIPFGSPWDWTCDFEKQTAIQLAKRGWPADYERKTTENLSSNNVTVAYLAGEGISLVKIFSRFKLLLQRRHNLYIFRPLYIFPFQRFSIIKKINNIIASFQLNGLVSILKN